MHRELPTLEIPFFNEFLLVRSLEWIQWWIIVGRMQLLTVDWDFFVEITVFQPFLSF